MRQPPAAVWGGRDALSFRRTLLSGRVPTFSWFSVRALRFWLAIWRACRQGPSAARHRMRWQQGVASIFCSLRRTKEKAIRKAFSIYFPEESSVTRVCYSIRKREIGINRNAIASYLRGDGILPIMRILYSYKSVDCTRSNRTVNCTTCKRTKRLLRLFNKYAPLTGPSCACFIASHIPVAGGAVPW